MNKPTASHRFFLLSATFVSVAVLLVGIGTVWRDELNALTDADRLHGLLYLLAAVGTVSLVGCALRYGKAWVKGAILSVLTFLVFWLFLEGLCGLVLLWRDKANFTILSQPKRTAQTPGRHVDFKLIHYDNLGISRPAPGPYETIYSTPAQTVPITYHIDSLSRRITPFDARQANGKYAVFLGCSFTYGESVADTNTLPYYFGQQTGFHPYNYGVSGYSPAHILALLQTVNLRNEVAEKNGVGFYIYIQDHLARVSPSTKWAYNSAGYLPWVNPKSVVVERTYARQHPVRLKLIQWMYKSNIVKLFKINFPRRYSTEQYQQFVNIVRKIEERYRSQFGNDDFYVVVFPQYPLDPELRQLFEQAHLKLLDYANLLTWNTAPDGMHPDGEAYRRVARQLAKDVCRRTDPKMTGGPVLTYSNAAETAHQKKRQPTKETVKDASVQDIEARREGD